MKATGIVRRIDDLGRVVIPKEIRKVLRIRDSEPLEIFIHKEGEIMLKKYSPINEIRGLAKQYAESLNQVTGRICIITDRDQVIAVAGGWKNALNQEITKQLEEKMEDRTGFAGIRGERSFLPIITEMWEEIIYEAGYPILSEGDVIGSVIFLEKDNKRKMTDTDMKLLQTAAGFLGRQME